jgi:hypothetical protein
MVDTTHMHEVDEIPFSDEIQKLGEGLLAEKEDIDAIMLITISKSGKETVALLGSPESIRTVLDHSHKSVEMVLAAVPTEKRQVN